MKRKGFTLIELLAVIVILAIIALIATPIVLNVIEDSKKKAFESTAYGLIDSAEKSIARAQLENSSIDQASYTFIDGSVTGLPSLEFQGEVPKSGNLSVTSDGKTELALWDGKYCLMKQKDESKVSFQDGLYEDECRLNIVVTPKDCFTGTVSADGLGYTITGYTCSDKDVIIPSRIDKLPVTTIGINAFKDKQLTSVVLPSMVKEIAVQSFSGNQLTSLTIPKSVTTLGNSAFYQNQLKNIVIPDSVISIGPYAFSYNQLTSVVIPNSVTTIGSSAFASNQLTSITIPASVTTIGNGAFARNQLPDAQAFIYNRKSDGTEDKTSLNSYGGKKRDHVIIPEGIKIIGDYSFEYTKVEKITFPTSLTSIGSHSFSDNLLTEVVLPEGVTDLGMRAFYRNQLTSISIPTSMRTIGQDCFIANKITELTIPNGVEKIGNEAFVKNNITSLSLPNSLTSIGVGAFTNNQLPDDQAFIYERKSDGTEDKTNLNSYGGAKKDNVIVPSGITSIGDRAFYTAGLKSITLPEGLTKIGLWSFAYNYELTNLIIPSSVTSIGQVAFNANSVLKLTINKPSGSITGSPWGAKSVEWNG